MSRVKLLIFVLSLLELLIKVQGLLLYVAVHGPNMFVSFIQGVHKVRVRPYAQIKLKFSKMHTDFMDTLYNII